MNATNYEPHPQVTVHLSMEQAQQLRSTLELEPFSHAPWGKELLARVTDAIEVASESQDGLDPEDHV